VINGAHTIVYADDAELARAFFRDVLGWPHVDDGGGWLIFQQPPSELGVHPVGPDAPAGHELFLLCDDVDATVAELRAKGRRVRGRGHGPGLGPAGHHARAGRGDDGPLPAGPPQPARHDW
jgi:catechol 2,3-dioxygenase-like lactoylglutathione lyase family enzyme